MNQQNKSLDVICIGRAAVDFYSQQVGCSLEDTSSLSKYLGGSAGNVAFGAGRLNLRSAMLTRVGDEHMGRYVQKALAAEGVDTSRLVVDAKRLTGLAILAIKDRDTFPLVFYRTDCADMALCEDDIPADYIRSARAILIQGTHLSTPGTRAATEKAVTFAKQSGTTVFLDIDYRPVLWGLAGLGEGENRFVTSDETSAVIQSILSRVDCIVGTEEEIHIAGGSTDTIDALKTIRRISDGVIVLKLGERGCTIIDGEVPDRLEHLRVYPGKKVDVFNVLGAGDAFMAGFLYGWVRSGSLDDAASCANACGALVVSRHGCAPAMPSETELAAYMDSPADLCRPDDDPTIRQHHRVANRSKSEWSNLCILAFDHRAQLLEMAAKSGSGAERIGALKKLILRAAQRVAAESPTDHQFGILVDGEFGQDVLSAASGGELWIGRPIEVPGSRPLEFIGGDSVAGQLRAWPVEQIVKCLVFYSPDDDIDLRNVQERRIGTLFEACEETGHELLLEIIPPESCEDWDDAIVRSVQRFYNLGIHPDWWKLPKLGEPALRLLSNLIEDRSPACRGVLTLGLSESSDVLAKSFSVSGYFDVSRGFAVGRTIFAEPSEQWFEGRLSDDELVDEVTRRYRELVNAWPVSAPAPLAHTR